MHIRLSSARCWSQRGLTRISSEGKGFSSLVSLFLQQALCSAGFHRGYGSLIAARALQGLGAAFLTPTSLSLVLGEFPKRETSHRHCRLGCSRSSCRRRGSGAWFRDHSFSKLEVGFFLINLPIGVWCWVQGRRVLMEPRLDSNAPVPRLAAVAQIALAVALVSLAIVQGKSWDGSVRKRFCPRVVE